MVALSTSLLPHSVSVVPVTAGTEDDYGNPADVAGTGVTERARLWQTAATENLAGRDVTADQWQGIFTAASVVTARSQVVWDSKTFEVSGTPSKVYDATSVHHIEAQLHYSGPVT